jgi:hypothetical protein
MADQATLRILVGHAKQMRYCIEAAATSPLASIATERVRRPLPNLGMFITKALEYQPTGFRVRLTVEKSKGVASNTPVGTLETRPDCWQGCAPEADEFRKRLSTTTLLNRSQKPFSLRIAIWMRPTRG